MTTNEALTYEMSIETEDERSEREWFEYEINTYLEMLDPPVVPKVPTDWELI